MAVAFCFRDGVITVARRTPKGALRLACGAPSGVIMAAVQGCARLSYDGKNWLVPGIPEAADGDDAVKAASDFARRLQSSVGRLLLDGEGA
jgi:hypothetical protein